MKIKTQLGLSFGLLLILIAALSIISATTINYIKRDTENILKNNYISVDYAQNMLKNLDNTSAISNSNFKQNLNKQSKNITEKGEDKITDSLTKYYQLWETHPSSVLKDSVRNQLLQIIQLNMQAIQSKSEMAKENANKGILWVAITSFLCFMIALIIVFNLPSHVANPIQELTQSILQIANENYTERVHFTNHSEYGQLATSFNTMAEKLQNYNNSNLAKIMMEKQRIETLINSMQDPVIGLDEEFNLLFINENAAKTLNIPIESVKNSNTESLKANNDLLRKLTENLTEAKQNEAALKITSHEKEAYYKKEVLHLHFTPVGEKSSKIIGYVLILRNITEFKELDQAKTNFIATVSHEFKTPIASINLSLNLLKNPKIGELNEEQNQLVNSINEDTHRLLKITSELLNMSQVESGKIKLHFTPNQPKELVNYAIEATKSSADQKSIQIQLDISNDLPQITLDAEKTTWILTNLLSNAIRYSYQNGEIKIKISRKNNFLRFSVQDFGQGIDPKYQDQLFERYFRVPGTQKEGTGLGLSISKEFIEAQNGNIAFKSELGAGSEFWFDLPL